MKDGRLENNLWQRRCPSIETDFQRISFPALYTSVGLVHLCPSGGYPTLRALPSCRRFGLELLKGNSFRPCRCAGVRFSVFRICMGLLGWMLELPAPQPNGNFRQSKAQEQAFAEAAGGGVERREMWGCLQIAICPYFKSGN
uniref:Uncharacterized protein n=1 Tax=Trichuris muris TaxID=70415 RepID=A0A5S6QAU1_TRIMR